jgi:hypothetical protein
MPPKKVDKASERNVTESISPERSVSPQPQSSYLPEAMRREIIELVKSTVTDTIKSLMPPELNKANIIPSTTTTTTTKTSRSPSGPPPTNPLPSKNAAIYTLQPQIKASDIGYFYPDMPSSWADVTSPSVEKEGRIYYRDIYAFTNRLNVFASTREASMITIRSIVDTCLKGEAELWWNNELDPITRTGIIHMPQGVSAWCSALEKRFRTPPSQALRILEGLQYTVWDAAEKKSATNYLSNVILAAKHCNYNEYSQLLLAWTHLDPELRISIDEPDEHTSISELMETLQRKQNVWFDRYAYLQRRQKQHELRYDNFPSNPPFNPPKRVIEGPPKWPRRQITANHTHTEDENDEKDQGEEAYHREPVQCIDCSVEFGSRNAMFKHLRTEHQPPSTM